MQFLVSVFPQQAYSIQFATVYVFYHGRDITILWDRTRDRYDHGRGFRILIEGEEVADSWKLKKLKVELE